MPSQKRLFKNIQQYININEKEVTILFTDVVASSSFWDSRGDVMGRLMIDFLNRVIFPIIRKYRGQIVKTIGDAVMASFKEPAQALKAAIAIQHALQHERKENSKIPMIRIGIHSGRAVVEKNDVFGDTVNVASRIEGEARGSEILLSARTVRKIGQKKFPMEKKGSFTPRGKRNPMTLYKCLWQDVNVETPKKGHATLVLGPLQRWEMIGAGLINLAMLVFLFLRYVRYLLADNEVLALLLLNPRHLLNDLPVLAGGLALLVIGMIVLAVRIRTIPMGVFRMLTGGVGFALAFFIFFAPTVWLPVNLPFNLDEAMHKSRNLFVEVQDAYAEIREEPSEKAAVLETKPRGVLLLLTNRAERGGLVWYKVLIDHGTYGWVLQIQPPKIGVPEKQITRAYWFYFRQRDLYNLIFACIGFIVGFFKFKLKAA